MNSNIAEIISRNRQIFHAVVDFNPATDRLLSFDFTRANTALTDELINYTKHFNWYINQQLSAGNYKYGIGGYNEDRILYRRSKHFAGEEARSIHLGIDIWAAAGTPVFAPLGGVIHSVGFNNNFGDYGATLILQHQLEGKVFHTLYGHISLADIQNIHPGKFINRGELVAHFGTPEENGDWPPHLHFQLIEDMELKQGDYPGVCSKSMREKYLNNCPDPDLILDMMQYCS